MLRLFLLIFVTAGLGCWNFDLDYQVEVSGCTLPGGTADASVEALSKDANTQPDSGALVQLRLACGGVGEACCSDVVACKGALQCDETNKVCLRCAAFEALSALDGDIVSQVRALSGNGSRVVGFSQGLSGEQRPVTWSAGSPIASPLTTKLGNRNMQSTVAAAVNFDGSAIVGWGTSFEEGLDAPFALLWRPFLSQIGQGRAQAVSGHSGSSADRLIVLGTTASMRDSFWWSRQEGLRPLPRMSSERIRGRYLTGWAISSDGTTVVGEGDSGQTPQRAFRWTQTDGSPSIGALPGGANSYATDVNHDGSIVVGVSETGEGSWSFQWTASDSTMSPIAPMDNEDAPPRIAAVAGEVVGTTSGELFLWKDSVFLPLREVAASIIPSNWELTNTVSISDDGKVLVGNGVSPNRERKGWRMVVADPCFSTSQQSPTPTGSVASPGEPRGLW